jgi:hypothetical protein
MALYLRGNSFPAHLKVQTSLKVPGGQILVADRLDAILYIGSVALHGRASQANVNWTKPGLVAERQQVQGGLMSAEPA